MKVFRVMLSALLLLAVVTGCSLFKASVRIVNNSSYTVVEVYLSPSDEEYWGDDLLSTSILPGSASTFDGIPARDCDFMAVEIGGGGWLSWETGLIAGQTFTWILTDATHID